jgi:hypothetical protein
MRLRGGNVVAEHIVHSQSGVRPEASSSGLLLSPAAEEELKGWRECNNKYIYRERETTEQGKD